MNAFHVLGGLLAVWALLVSYLGITREGFPSKGAQERVVATISILLAVGAIGSAIYVGATEEEEEEHEGEAAALVR